MIPAFTTLVVLAPRARRNIMRPLRLCSFLILLDPTAVARALKVTSAPMYLVDLTTGNLYFIDRLIFEGKFRAEQRMTDFLRLTWLFKSSSRLSIK